MDPRQSLVRPSSALTVTGKHSLKPQEVTLLREMDLTAANAKVELTPELSGEWLRVLHQFPAEAVEAAFRGWRDVSPFFPAISEIRDLCGLYVRRVREMKEAQQKAEEKQTTEAARDRGELIDFTDIVKKLNETVGKMPEPPHIKRLRKSRQPEAVRVIPPVVLTQEQIDARREAEQKEIKRYEEQA